MTNGLVTNENPPIEKPAFYAFQNVVAKLAAVKYVGMLTDAEIGVESMEAYEFVRNIDGKTLYVAWLDPIDTADVATLAVVGSQATVYDIYGNKSVVNDGDDGTVDGKVHVQVSGQPVYIEVN